MTDILDEIRKLLEVKRGTEDSAARRANQIKWIWGCIISMMATGTTWIVFGTIWYAKMEHVARAVELIYPQVFGTPMP